MTPKWAAVVVFGLFGLVLQCLLEHVLLGPLTVAVAGSAAAVEEVDGFSKSSLVFQMSVYSSSLIRLSGQRKTGLNV